jgi:tetratricopeptide (TPR) repeat protein
MQRAELPPCPPPSALRGSDDGGSWVLGALLFIGSAATGLTPVADGDVFWHMAAGREIFRSGSLLHRDMFSVSAAGRPWLDVHWLFQLAVFGLHALGGLATLVLAKCLLVGVAALCLLTALDRTERVLFVPLCIGSLFLTRHLLLVRPVIITLLFLAFFFLRLERFRRDGKAARLLWQLPLAQIVWSNCQGLFALGPALVGAYLLSAVASAFGRDSSWFPFALESALASSRRHVRTLGLTLLLCCAGSLATPYGTSALALPLKLLLRLAPHAANPFEDVAENLPPFVLERFSPEQFWHFKWFLGLLALTFVLSRGRAVLSHLLLLAGFAGLALISNRNVLLFYWMVTPIAAMQLAPIARRAALWLRRYPVAAPMRWLPHSILASLLFAVGTAAAREPRFSEPSPFHVPVEAVQVITQMSGCGTIFSADHQGGYVIWKLYPRFKPYIDTRLVLRTADQYREYLDLADHPERFDAFQRRHGFSYVILPVAYPDRYLRLIAHLHDSSDWRLIYTDGSDVVFARQFLRPTAPLDMNAAATTARILDGLEARYARTPRLLDSGRIQLATLDIALQAYDQAERILSDMPSPAARALQARSRLLRGDLDGAEEIAEKLLREDEQDVQSLDLMAMLYVRRARFSYALTFLRRALVIDPFDGEATRLLGELEEYQHAR